MPDKRQLLARKRMITKNRGDEKEEANDLHEVSAGLIITLVGRHDC